MKKMMKSAVALLLCALMACSGTLSVVAENGTVENVVVESLQNEVEETTSEASEIPTPEVSATPEVSETPEPEVSETPAPEASATPEVNVTSAPEASATPTPEVSETPEPEVSETPAPEASATPTPEVSETPAPEVSASPEVSEAPVPEESASPEVSATPTPEVSTSPEASEAPAPEESASSETSTGPVVTEGSETTSENNLVIISVDNNHVGRKGKLTRGTVVYEKTDGTGNSHTCIFDYEEITIVDHFIIGDVEWYQYSCSSIFDVLGALPYVKAADVTLYVEKDEFGIPLCDCGYTGDRGLEDHADNCARKTYLRDIYIVEKSAVEIYADWSTMDIETQNAVLTFLSWKDQNKLTELNTLILGSETPGGEEDEDISVGDFEAISKHMGVLEQEVRKIKSYSECQDFYAGMIEVYSKAFDNDVLMVETEELAQIDNQFDALENYLLNEFGYTRYQSGAAVFSSMATNSYSNSSATDDGSIIVDKDVEKIGDEDSRNFLLTLESYATGADRVETVPADIVLVLDQSASMYTPMGLSGYLKNYGTDNAGTFDDWGNTSVQQLTVDDVINSVNEKKTEYSRLGYLLAQSEVVSHIYCCNGTAKEGCLGKHDFYIVQYVENDSDGKTWHFYRVPNTSTPSIDNDSWHGNDNNVDLTKYTTIELSNAEIGKNQFYFYKTQFAALYDAVTTYIQSIVDDEVGHRLAIVGYAGSLIAEYMGSYDGNGVYTPANFPKESATGSGLYINGTFNLYDTNFKREESKYGVTFNYIDEGEYAQALVDVNANTESIWNSVNAIKTDYAGTCHWAGLDMAYNILYPNGKDETADRDEIVILFSDGTPSCGRCEVSEHDTVAKAKYLKDAGAEVYTIATATVGENTFMSYASSDYPDAEDKDNGGTKITEPKYAMAVADSEDMNDAFGSINVSSTTVTLGEEAVLKDVLTKYFVLPKTLTDELKDKSEADASEEIKKHIKVYTADFTGEYSDSTPIFGEKSLFEDAEIKLEKDSTGTYRTINVTNFDYSANYISTVARSEIEGGEANFYGCKLVVEIPIEPNPDFLGGNGVVTNEANSGIYDKDNALVEGFPIPDVDVKVSTITPKFTSKNIYLSQWASLPEVLNLGQFTQNDDDWVIDTINNAYVDIVYTVTGPDKLTMTYRIPAGGSLVGQWWDTPEGASTHPLLKEDTTYMVTCTVTSKNNSSNHSHTETQEKILVYKPEITFKDSSIELGTEADYEDNYVVNDDVDKDNVNEDNLNVVWKHGSVQADESMGIPPTLVYTFDPAAGKFTKETPVKVTVTAKKNDYNIPIDQDITDYVTFYRDACDFDGCNHDEKTEVNALAADRINFVVHICSFDLIIKKSGAEEIDENQSFVFRIEGPDGFTMDVVIEGNGSVKVISLPVSDEYTVKELTDWSWRYEAEDSVIEVNIGEAKNGTVTVDFENKRMEDKWLSGDCYCENWWGGTNTNEPIIKRSSDDSESGTQDNE